MSFLDARNLPNGHRIESDLCIIGSGAAGLARPYGGVALAGRSRDCGRSRITRVLGPKAAFPSLL